MPQNFSISLADIPQDIAGIIPLDLIKLWQEGEKTIEAHQELLAPYMVEGTVVCSDSAGLSKLSQRVTAMEAMKLVSEPKEIIYAYGSQIGRKPLGIWAADNTQMFYGQDIMIDDILDQMIAAQKEIADLTVQVGMGIHTGNFIKIGDSLFGNDAIFIEEFAENYTAGKEIAVTEAVFLKLSDEKRKLLQRRKDGMHAKTFTIEYKDLISNAEKSSDTKYPIPFSPDFYEYLQSYASEELETHAGEMSQYKKQKVVILSKVIHKEHFFLLDTFTDWTFCNAAMIQEAKNHNIEIIKSNGDLGIFVCEEGSQAVDFAKSLCQTLSESDFEINCGISQGEVLIFPLEKGGVDIAGGPVNIASKIAEDSGKSGVMLHECVSCLHNSIEDFCVTISGIEIKGKVY
ncbi:MAG: hypothetical protein ACK4NC_01845 [Candidatus Gracilibacteria bacterium]